MFYRLNMIIGKKHTHSTAGTAEQVSGSPAFNAGAMLAVTPTAITYLGTTKLQAEANLLACPPNQTTFVQLPNNDTTLWVDAPNSTVVVFTEVGKQNE